MTIDLDSRIQRFARALEAQSEELDINNLPEGEVFVDNGVDHSSRRRHFMLGSTLVVAALIVVGLVSLRAHQSPIRTGAVEPGGPSVTPAVSGKGAVAPSPAATVAPTDTPATTAMYQYLHPLAVFLSGGDDAQIAQDIYESTVSTCMTAQHWNYGPSVRTSIEALPVKLADIEAARQDHGYGPVAQTKTRSVPIRVDPSTLSAADRTRYNTDLYGSATPPPDEYDSVGGCAAAGVKAKIASVPEENPELLKLYRPMLQQLTATTSISQAWDQWRNCMAVAGYTFKDSDGAQAAVQAATPDVQIAVASKDLECQEKHLLPVTYPMEINYVHQLVAAFPQYAALADSLRIDAEATQSAGSPGLGVPALPVPETVVTTTVPATSVALTVAPPPTIDVPLDATQAARLQRFNAQTGLPNEVRNMPAWVPVCGAATDGPCPIAGWVFKPDLYVDPETQSNPGATTPPSFGAVVVNEQGIQVGYFGTNGFISLTDAKAMGTPPAPKISMGQPPSPSPTHT